MLEVLFPFSGCAFDKEVIRSYVKNAVVCDDMYTSCEGQRREQQVQERPVK